MLPTKVDYYSLKLLLNEIIDKRAYNTGWKELSYDIICGGESKRNGNRYHYFRKLKPREQKVLRMRYGLGKGEFPMTLQAIGNKIGITREGVRQLINKAVKNFEKIYREDYTRNCHKYSDKIKKKEAIFLYEMQNALKDKYTQEEIANILQISSGNLSGKLQMGKLLKNKTN
ncbi:hypothetical protein KY314_03235 [Candidatus Woesearchaeota archaeon]|nr:hypothetical protein [Candidatus Woesearchaeota archaeon]